MKELEVGKTCALCACGQSGNQPWCDGSHEGTQFAPKILRVEETKIAAMCICKQTKNPPFCDGSHRNP